MKALKIKAVFNSSALLALNFLLVSSLRAQEADSKQEAAVEFEKGNYSKAISLLKQAAAENPNDAEIHYYLGYYTHYLCYDSRPLVGYDEKWSDKVLEHLNKAITLDPKYGDAYYFIGCEYGGRFRNAMQEREIKKMRKEILAGRKKGGYPDWLIEYAQNILRSCDPNAILFAGGDAEINPIRYLQFVEDYRTDVTVIPIFALNVPWYAMILKNGLDDILVSAPISWSEEQILGMHPYKWKITEIEIPISKRELEKYGISLQKNKMNWKLEPDLSFDSQTYLSGGRALLANIIETNQWERSIYFTVGCPKSGMAGLNKYMQLSGLVFKMLPVETEKNNLSLDPEKIETVLFQSKHYQHFADVNEHNMPRASRLLYNYHVILLSLARHYFETENKDSAKDILDFMGTYMPETVFPLPAAMKKAMESLRSDLEIEG